MGYQNLATARVLVVYNDVGDAQAIEDADTLAQRDEAIAALQGLVASVQSAPFGHCLATLERKVLTYKPTIIVNLVESLRGTDALLPFAAMMYAYLGIPYTGCGAEVLGLLSRKTKQKQFLQAFGLATPLDLSAAGTTGSYIVKSDTEHASKGLDDKSIVQGALAAQKLIAEKQKFYGGQWFAEAFVTGREFNVSLIDRGNGQADVLPVAEIQFINYPENKPKIVGFEAKWETESFSYSATPRRFDFPDDDAALLEKLAELSQKCWNVFGLRGAARVDFRVAENGTPFILEVNANPCLSADAGFMAAAAKAALTPEDVWKKLLNAARI